ncbi:ZYRO0C18612p [Zygosaccharomyces rouxii]|uniref:ZYRO0C18612p n=1 Tax=Zygosaccharomyces rouxii (strain ATCC 2623 / CBS 732 / NBRC 1130 / NCYC 568 / NRRL Y-229) TaxID=559307 RepID=C5DUP8_ZYGRC|nr:uncharacterized protein ZYRO0C18612g [Zygosaccharomyces rouxii]KAH9199722.1 hypothetical protein LQ764DRAFT_179910 [Zygosaccharomyces rouxii]CAR27509.1 ZYRO0C18612p [Zygosaccharomyces rouxii]
MHCNHWQPRMQIYPFLIFCALWALGTTQEFVPTVWRSNVEVYETDFEHWGGILDAFRDSNTLMFHFEDNFEDRLLITFDSGRNWRTVDVFGEGIPWVDVDEFHKERAFVTTSSGKVHMTEDQGRSWKQLSLPQETEGQSDCFFDTHPFNTNLLLLRCGITRESQDSHYFREDVAYASDDAGKSFRRISAPFEEYEATQDLEYRGTTCKFATSSKESIFDRDGIYCMHRLRSRTEIQKQSTHPYGMNIGKKNFRETQPSVPKRYTMGIAFYTTDLGQSTKLFDELEGFPVKDVSILPSHVLVTTSEANEADGAANRLWVSTGGPFKPARLPKRVAYLPPMVSMSLELDRERILLHAVLEEDEGHGKSEHLLLSDSSGLNFSLIDSIAQEPAQHVMFEKLNNLEGTIWGEFIFEEVHNRSTELGMDETNLDKKVNWLQRIIEFIKKHVLHRKPYPLMEPFPFIEYKRFSKNKISFDNGETWTNLKVVDPSGKHKNLFQCDIDDVEHCSFQKKKFYSPLIRNEPTAGILMETGVVRERSLILGEKDAMAFISRDGGASWEVAFEFPVYAAFLDFGNIIVAIPKLSQKNGRTLKKFFYSVDQGNNWREYYLDIVLDEPAHAYDLVLDSWGLNAVIGLVKQKYERSSKYTFYTIDFSEVFGGSACTDGDWEKWYLSDGKCLNGVKYSFNRRKADAQCLMRKAFEELTLNEESCEPKDSQSSI